MWNVSAAWNAQLADMEYQDCCFLSCWLLPKLHSAVVVHCLLGGCVSFPSPGFSLSSKHMCKVLSCFNLLAQVQMCEKGGQGDEAMVEEACHC